MADVETLTSATSAPRLNVADRLAAVARELPHATAIVCPRKYSPTCLTLARGDSGAWYATTTFGALDADATRIARGLLAWGVPPDTRLALLVRPGIEFVTLVFALLRAGMVIVLVDPGLGRRNLIRCLSEAEPEGFVAVGLAQAVRQLLRRKFRRARWNVTVGRRWFWGGLTLEKLRAHGDGANVALPTTSADDPAAIIFTSGSTGPPKGVLYTQRMFDTQVGEIQSMYGIEPGGADLGCFPLFALFNAAMGVTTVLPDMNFSRPASAKPKQLLAAANDWKVTQAFASPAVWRVLSGYCTKHGGRIPSLRQVFSCGAPVPADVLRATLTIVGENAKMHTPYGATECLPVSTIEAAEVIGETAARTGAGAGVCVGCKFDSIEWRVIRIMDEPIASIDEAETLQPGEIGELIVRGPQVSPMYATRGEFNSGAKIFDERAGASSPQHGAEDRPARFENSRTSFQPWHRTGDVGYLDEQGRFWYCGRKSQRVETASGPLFTECVEGIFNTHPHVERSALVGIGPKGDQIPIVCVELVGIDKSTTRKPAAECRRMMSEIIVWKDGINELSCIQHVEYYPEFPVDVRHNAKIFREYVRNTMCFMILAEPEFYGPELVERAKFTTKIDAHVPEPLTFSSPSSRGR